MCSLNGKHIPDYHYFFSLLWTSTFNILYIFMNVKEKVLQGFQIHSLKTGPHPCHKAGNNFWLKIWQRRDNRRGKLLACSLSEGDLGLWVAGQSHLYTGFKFWAYQKELNQWRLSLLKTRQMVKLGKLTTRQYSMVFLNSELGRYA